MKALTARQQDALNKINSQDGSTRGIDRGMVAALIHKGYLISDGRGKAPQAAANESHVIYNPRNHNRIVHVRGRGAGVLKPARYASLAAARGALTRMARSGSRYHSDHADYRIASATEYATLDTTVKQVNLMTGQEYLEDANTPSYCSPSSEAYWSM